MFMTCPSIDRSKAYLLGIGKSFLYICSDRFVHHLRSDGTFAIGGLTSLS